MASAEVIADLRRKIGDTAEPFTYSDDVLGPLLDAAADDTNAVAADIWEEKSVAFSMMVDISEAGSSRKNSDLFRNAQTMAAHYRGQVAEAVADEVRSTTRPIVRA